MRVAALTLVAAVLVGACGSRTGLFVPKSPCTFPDEPQIVDLANDTTLAPADYVSLCQLSDAQASALVRGRRYASAAEVDALPELNQGVCARLIACAQRHDRKQAPCTPNHHPDVVLELVVDESGSMTGDKWDALRDSLLALFTDIEADKDAALRVGVVMFDDVATNRVAPAPLTDPAHVSNLHRTIDKPNPHGGGTSTEQALEAAFEVVDAEPSGVRRVVVLLSDGSPTGGDEEKEQCVALAKDENFAHGAQLFSVGIGPFPSSLPTLYDPAFMGRLALAGATAPKGCVYDSTDESKICHFQITPGGDPEKLQESFGAALDAIRESATTCP
jgi:uncharacterized protein YegL